MAMGLAAVIALPGPPTRRPGRLGGESLFRTGAGLFWPGFRQRGLLQRAKDARIIYAIRPIFSGEMTIDDRATARLVILRATNCPKELIR